ncbi:lim domain-containing protein [Ophiostoma piceae UAMH 11346]|uniref:Lim domain-containing protein n=1 Tax=Ophiostoma piceae (strain UAMH 11346) TaxID=1262450 RepID=S3BS48_OPHP1|nr:lim domain-containing protein [Ophiostoma piceae UAMH 11346]
MSTFGRSSSRKVTPPSSSYMSNDQFANYLTDLRNNRVSRPGGARPLPSNGSSSLRDSGRISIGSRVSFGASSVAPAPAPTASSTVSASDAPALPSPLVSDSSSSIAQQRTSFDAPSVAGRPSIGNHSTYGSVSSRYSSISGRGRDYYPEKSATKQNPQLSRPLLPDEVVPTDTYMERGQRWMEKEEVVSLRHALEDMDLQDHVQEPQTSAALAARPPSSDPEGQRLYDAALGEAAELVWQHQNGIKPPEAGAPYQYKQHLRKNSYAYARTASVGTYGDEIQPTGLARDSGSRSVSGSSASSSGSVSGTKRSRASMGSKRVVSGGSSSSGSGTDSARQSLDQHRASATDGKSVATASSGSLRSKAYKGLAGGPRPMASASSSSSSGAAANSVAAAVGRRRSSMKRNISGEIQKPFSGNQIYEEPETSTPEKRAKGFSGSVSSVLKTKAESNVNSTDGTLAKGGFSKLVSRYEIHRNPPSQSRNPQYTTNEQLPQVQDTVETLPDVPRKNGVEIRSEDIRQATSMKLKDRNPKLPTPSFVSDTPGRPIVSFDANWKAPVDDAATDTKPGAREKICYTSASNSNTNDTSSTSNTISTPFTQAEKTDTKAGNSEAATPASTTRGAAPVPVPISVLEEPAVRSQPPSIPTISVSEEPVSRQPPRTIPTISISEEPGTRQQAPPIPTISVSEEPVSRQRAPPVPSISISKELPACSQTVNIPTIVLPGGDDDEPTPAPGVPSIVIPGSGSGSNRVQPSIPVIITPGDAGHSRPAQPPVPTITTTPSAPASGRPLPQPVSSRPRGHWSRAPVHPQSAPSSTGSVSGSRATARCHECRYPIEGRFIALKGIPGAGSNGSDGSERFHPQCFRCYTCGTSLEALEISPEPDASRNARLERIFRRARGEVLDEKPGETMGEDGDDRLRFYCHLDWHEQFAPRCKHCTTPIVGEHVVALGQHWHVGHFFCAECGDPFGAGATHIEKDGYAWCVKCQTQRTERRAPKCRACGKAAIGQYVQALGAEWHDDCFRCAVCSGGFSDGQIFPRQGTGGLMQVVCTGCRQRELKA